MKKLAAIFLAAQFLVPAFFTSHASAAPEFTLSLSLMVPPIHNRWKNAIKPWADEIEKRSNGRIKIEPYFAEALCKAADSFEAVKNGTADIAEFCFDMCPGQFPFHERAFTLISPDRSLDKPGEMLSAIEKKYPVVMKELDGAKLLFTHAVNVGMLVGTKKPISSLADLGKMKINVDGDAQAATKVSKLGSSTVYIPTSDLFMSLQQGVVDGTTCDFEILVSRRFGEEIRHMTLFNTAASAFAMVMNQDAYNGLPDDLRKVVDEVSVEYGTKGFDKFWSEGQYTAIQNWKKTYNGAIHMLSDADYAKGREASGVAEKEWIKVVSDAGLPGAEIAKAFHEMEPNYTSLWKDSRTVSYMK